ncbi:ABC transporter ATP-binding protein [Streptosporangium carneum]|uniref:Multidrug ABC transporter ATP-binding protein n=1 Tax=Streptosporangium carneum TaxID=47481 RepID=A0A9W6IBP1_9ACTN|nr:ABC transporter ATP-binding protein [Streptosporangium carneum]GLK14629.1 multidrug ABC transporter ATP-binding protein [Streptosporangium carneum]
MITLRGLTKRYGEKTAVDNISLDIAPGKVTGFLGPNGAGKSTTMRMILGLDKPTSGQALVSGKPYTTLRHPVREVGALLEARSVHPGRSARNHLLAMARTHSISAKRVDEVLQTVGLSEVANKRAGSFSLGMGQRLGIATALLGDPPILILDEPVNGLDPDGVRWVRDLTRRLAAEGRTVFLSSHLMSEMELTADHLVVIGKGRLLADLPMTELIAKSSRHVVRLQSPQIRGLDLLCSRLTAEAADVQWTGDGEILIRGASASRVGDLAHEIGLRLHELTLISASLEEAYIELTSGSVEFGTSSARSQPPGFGGRHEKAEVL